MPVALAAPSSIGTGARRSAAARAVSPRLEREGKARRAAYRIAYLARHHNPVKGVTIAIRISGNGGGKPRLVWCGAAREGIQCVRRALRSAENSHKRRFKGALIAIAASVCSIAIGIVLTPKSAAVDSSIGEWREGGRGREEDSSAGDSQRSPPLVGGTTGRSHTLRSAPPRLPTGAVALALRCRCFAVTKRRILSATVAKRKSSGRGAKSASPRGGGGGGSSSCLWGRQQQEVEQTVPDGILNTCEETSREKAGRLGPAALLQLCLGEHPVRQQAHTHTTGVYGAADLTALLGRTLSSLLLRC